MRREHLMCLLSVRLIILVVLLHETIALNAIYNHCVFRNGSTNIQIFLQITKIIPQFVECVSLNVYNPWGSSLPIFSKFTKFIKFSKLTNFLEILAQSKNFS